MRLLIGGNVNLNQGAFESKIILDNKKSDVSILIFPEIDKAGDRIKKGDVQIYVKFSHAIYTILVVKVE